MFIPEMLQFFYITVLGVAFCATKSLSLGKEKFSSPHSNFLSSLSVFGLAGHSLGQIAYSNTIERERKRGPRNLEIRSPMAPSRAEWTFQ